MTSDEYIPLNNLSLMLIHLNQLHKIPKEMIDRIKIIPFYNELVLLPYKDNEDSIEKQIKQLFHIP